MARAILAIETHPVQYRAPMYRALEQKCLVPVTVIYGSDFSIAGYRDEEFGSIFSWDTDLISGYRSIFLSRVKQGGAKSHGQVSTRGLSRAISEIAPSAILLTGYSPRFHLIAFYRAWRSGLPILFRAETTDHARSRNSFKSAMRKYALRWLYRHCARLLYVGRRSEEHFRDLGIPFDRLVFAPYCVDTGAFRASEEDRAALRPVARREIGAKEDDLVILQAGKLSLRKGPDLLLAALRSMDAELRERVLVLFVGSGELEDELRSAAAGVPSVRTHFAGFQNQTRLSPYYHAADLMVLPSREFETWGLVVNEALYHGVPCVVSDAVGCAPDLIEPGQTGEIAAAGSVEHLREAIGRAVTLTGCARIRAGCRARVSGYTVEKAAQGIAQAFREVATDGPAGES